MAIGKAEAMKTAATNRPVGSKYNRLMGAWLRKHGLSEITPAERYRILNILDNLAAIETWRDGLKPESGGGSTIRRRSGRTGALVSRLAKPGNSGCIWSLATPAGRGVARRYIGDKSTSAEPPWLCAMASALA